MKTSQFKTFIKTLETADEQNDIWWAGYLWMDLTQKQIWKAEEILWSLEKSDIIKTDLANGWFIFPSGLKLKIQ